MFRWLINLSLDYRFLVIISAVALITFSREQIEKMPVEVFPEFAPPIVEVQTEAIGLSADEVESLVTLGLEELLNGVPWLESTRSVSVTGLSVITLTFKRGTDIIKARQMAQERLALAYTLPNVATPPVIMQPRSAVSRFMMVGISSDGHRPHRVVAHRPVDNQATPGGCARRRQRGDLGTTPEADAYPDRSRTPGKQRPYTGRHHRRGR